MLNFKASVSKGWKRYSIVIKAESKEEAKAKLHKEWYSILSLDETQNIDMSWKKFLFEVIISGEKKKWAIVWDDIFKTYVKLIDDLKYKVISLYPENIKDNQFEIDKLITRLEGQYKIYSINKRKEEEKNKWEESTWPKKEEKKERETPMYMEQKLNEYYENLDLVLVKIDNILTLKEESILTPEKRRNLEDLKIWIKKIKSSTNISKIKEVSEKSLTKIWELELSLYERYKNDKAKIEMKKTNQLLKQVWSKKSFIEKEKDINYILSQLKEKVSSFFSKEKRKKIKKVWIDKTSDDYVKTVLLINKYEDKLSILRKELFKKFYYSFAWKEKRDEFDIIVVKKAVVEQNLKLLNAKIKWVPFSYTKIKKWYQVFLDMILTVLRFINDSLYYAIVLCIVSFVWVVCANYYFNIWFDFPKNSILFFVIIQLLFLLILTIRWFLSLIINFAIFSLMIILLLVNF